MAKKTNQENKNVVRQERSDTIRRRHLFTAHGPKSERISLREPFLMITERQLSKRLRNIADHFDIINDHVDILRSLDGIIAELQSVREEAVKEQETQKSPTTLTTS